MKVVIINKSDIVGGAAIGAYRICRALQTTNIQVTMLVQQSKLHHDYITASSTNTFQKTLDFLYFSLERFSFLFHEKDASVRFSFSTAQFGEDISKHQLVKNADIIHLHWINFGFLSIKTLQKLFALRKPIVWTLHDMWAFTGGCHHSYECSKFIKSCGNCFYLKNPNNNDLSHKVWKKKAKLFSNQALNVVSVSSWLSQQAKKSSLFTNKNHFVIHNAADEDFNAIEKHTARKKLNIDQDKNVILFGSAKINDSIKGFDYFVEALKILADKKEIDKNKVLILLFGNVKGDLSSQFSQIPFEYLHLGYISDKNQLMTIYSASTLTVVSSLYETFGQVIAESMICRTPVVAFNNSGPKDIIKHKENGYLAIYKSSEDICRGITWILYQSDYERISYNAEKYIKDNFSANNIAKKYVELYKSILE